MFEEYIIKRIRKVFDYIAPFKFADWSAKKITLAIEFYPVPYNSDKIAFIPTGSKDMPAGISTISDVYLLFFDEEQVNSPFVYHIDVVKDYMKENLDKISERQNMDEGFNHIGYEIDLSDLISFSEMNPLVLTSH